jgi:hypothetical protein
MDELEKLLERIEQRIEDHQAQWEISFGAAEDELRSAAERASNRSFAVSAHAMLAEARIIRCMIQRRIKELKE